MTEDPKPTDEDVRRIQEASARYVAAAHAMQSGVKMLMARQGAPGVEELGETSPKHLRVGVNMALIDSGALAKLLIDKGIITEAEYYESLAEFAENEQKVYEMKLGVHLA